LACCEVSGMGTISASIPSDCSAFNFAAIALKSASRGAPGD
jgi:hypothetical protein